MSTYIFILGKDSELSVAELQAQFPSLKILLQSDSFVVLDLDKDIDQKIFDKLGGQVKLGEVLGVCEKQELKSKIADYLEKNHDSGKLNYGLSLYGLSEKNLRPLLLDLKKEFKRRGVSSRFANQNFLNLSIAQHKGLKGKEIIVAKHGADFYAAEVIATQNIDAYSKRDYKKPFRSMKVGMLPPKLAQIMINLAGDVSTVWDPFCGGGVLIMEGLLMGHKMLGSDIDVMTLEGAKRNVDWVKKEFNLKSQVDLFVHDATKPIPDKKFDAIVFEGYLGPPQSNLKPKKAFEPLVQELTDLYVRFFERIKQSNFKGSVIIGLPFFRTREGDLSLDQVMKKVEVMGFKIDLNLKYARRDQLVGRQVLRMKLA